MRLTDTISSMFFFRFQCYIWYKAIFLNISLSKRVFFFFNGRLRAYILWSMLLIRNTDPAIHSVRHQIDNGSSSQDFARNILIIVHISASVAYIIKIVKDKILFTVWTCMDMNHGSIIVDMLLKCKCHGGKWWENCSNYHIEPIIIWF